MHIGYIIWNLFCIAAGVWIGDVGWGEDLAGGLIGFVFGILTSVAYASGGMAFFSDMAGDAVETIGDVLDD